MAAVLFVKGVLGGSCPFLKAVLRSFKGVFKAWFKGFLSVKGFC